MHIEIIYNKVKIEIRKNEGIYVIIRLFDLIIKK